MEAAFYGQVFESWCHRRLSRGGTFTVRALDNDNRSEIVLPECKAIDRFTLLSEAKGKEVRNCPLCDVYVCQGYWVPYRSDFPVLDAVSPPCVMFQMTVSANHGIKHQRLLEHLKVGGARLTLTRTGAGNSESTHHFRCPAHACRRFPSAKLPSGKDQGSHAPGGAR
jgi:hypothetical protein